MPTQVETIDPELQFESLPEPFRTIDNIVLGIVNNAWSEIRERSTSLNAGRYRQRLPDARPSKITDAATLLSDYDCRSTNITCISQTVSYTSSAHLVPSDNIGLPPPSSDVGQGLVLGEEAGDVVITAPPGTTFDGLGTALRLSVFAPAAAAAAPTASPVVPSDSWPHLVSTTSAVQAAGQEGEGAQGILPPWQDALVCEGGVVSLPDVIQAPAPYHYQPPLLPDASQAGGPPRSPSPARAQPQAQVGEEDGEGITARLARVQARPTAALLPTWSQVERERGLLLAVAGTVVGCSSGRQGEGDGEGLGTTPSCTPIPHTGTIRILHVPRAALGAGGHWSCAAAGRSETGGYLSPIPMPSMAELDPGHRPADAAALSARIGEALSELAARQVRWLASIHLPHGLTAHRLSMSLDSTHLAVLCSDASVRVYHLHPGVVTPPPLPPAAPTAQEIVQLAAARGAALALAGQGGADVASAPPPLLLPIPPAPVDLSPLLVLSPPPVTGLPPLPFTLALPGLHAKLARQGQQGKRGEEAEEGGSDALPRLHVGFHFLSSRTHPPPLPVPAGGEEGEGGDGGRKGGARGSVAESKSQGGRGSVAPSRIGGGRTSLPRGSSSGSTVAGGAGRGRGGGRSASSSSSPSRAGSKVVTGAAALPPPPPPTRHAPAVVGADGVPVTSGCVVWWSMGPGQQGGEEQEGLNAIHRYSLPLPLEQAMREPPHIAAPPAPTPAPSPTPAPAPAPAPVAAAPAKGAPAARPASAKGAPAAPVVAAAPAPPSPRALPYPYLPACSTPVPYPITSSLLLPGPGPAYCTHEVYSTAAGLPSHAHPVLLVGDAAGHVSAYTFPGAEGGAPQAWATLARHTGSPTLHAALGLAEGQAGGAPPAQSVTALVASADGLYALSCSAGGQALFLDLHAALGKDAARTAATPTCTHGPGGYEVGTFPGQPYNAGLGLVGGSLLWKSSGGSASGGSKGGGDAQQVLSLHTNVHAVRWDGTGPALSARCLGGQPIALVEMLEPVCDRRGTPCSFPLPLQAGQEGGGGVRTVYAYDMPSGALLGAVRAKSGGATGVLLPSPVAPPRPTPGGHGGGRPTVLCGHVCPGLPLPPSLWTTSGDSVLLATRTPSRGASRPVASVHRPSLGGNEDGTVLPPSSSPSPRPYGCDIALWTSYDLIRAGCGPVGLAVRRSTLPAAQSAWSMSGVPHPDALTASLYLGLSLAARHRALDLQTLLGGGAGPGEGMVAVADALLQKFVAQAGGPGGGGGGYALHSSGVRGRRSSLAGGRRASLSLGGGDTTSGAAPALQGGATQGRRVSISGPEAAGGAAGTVGRGHGAGVGQMVDRHAGEGNVFSALGQRDAQLSAGREASASAPALLAAQGQRYSNPHSPVDCAGYMTSLLLQTSSSPVAALLATARAGRQSARGAVTVATLQKEYYMA